LIWHVPHNASNSSSIFACLFVAARNTTLRKLVLYPSSGKTLLSWARSVELVPISWHRHQYKIGYMNQPQHKPAVTVKTNMKSIKKLHTWGLEPMSMQYAMASVYKISVLWEYKPSLKR
jgi:hypothetical protein